MEFEFLLELWIHNCPPAFPLHFLAILLVVPALGFIECHEKQHKLPHVNQLLVQSAFSAH